MLDGRAAEFERDIPFGLIVDALNDYFGSLEPVVLRALDEDVPRELADIFPALPRDPESGVIQEEVVAISDGARCALESAAVAGESFEPEFAAAISEQDVPSVLAALDELLASEFIRPTETPRRFRFRHPIVRRAVYDGIPRGWSSARTRGRQRRSKLPMRRPASAPTTSRARPPSATSRRSRCSSRRVATPRRAPRRPPAREAVARSEHLTETFFSSLSRLRAAVR